MKNSRNKNNKTKNNFVKNQKSQKFQEYKKNNNDLAEKSLRIVMGLHSVKELFKVRQNSIVKLMLRDDWNRSSDLVDIYKVAERNRIKIEEVSAEKLNKIEIGRAHV